MSLEIDPDSINLGKDDPKYFAEYSPRQTPEPGSDCALPPGVTFTLPETALIDLDPSCAYQFPESLLSLPPVYYPPQVKPYPACEQFGASTDIQFLHLAAKNSFLIVETSGPVKEGQTDDEALTDDSPNDCSLRITGKFDIEACDKILTQTAISLGEYLAGDLQLLATENCSVALVGGLQYTGCPYYNVASNVTFAPLFRGSNLELVAQNNNPCELTVTGFFDADVCEEFNAKNTINLTGKVVKNQKSILDVSEKNPCGFDFSYTAEIEACSDVTVDGTVNLTGDPKYVKINKPITLSTGNGAPDCSLELDGDIEFDIPNPGCTELKYSDTSTIYGRAVKEHVPKYATVATSTEENPVCGVEIGGEMEIQACPTYPIKYLNKWYQVKELTTLSLPSTFLNDPVGVAKYIDAVRNGNVYGSNGAVPGSTFSGVQALNINFVDKGQVIAQKTVKGYKFSPPPVVKQLSSVQNFNYPACGSLVQNAYFTDVCSEFYLDFPYSPEQSSTITIYGSDGSVGRGCFKVSAVAENAPGTPRGCGKSIYLMASKNIDIFMDFDDNEDGSGDVYGGDAAMVEKCAYGAGPGGGGGTYTEEAWIQNIIDGGVPGGGGGGGGGGNGAGGGGGGGGGGSGGGGINGSGGCCNFGCDETPAASGSKGKVWDAKKRKWVPHAGGATGALVRPDRKKKVAIELRDIFVNNIYPAQNPCCKENGMMIDMCKGNITGLKNMQIARADGKLWDMPTVPAGASPKWYPIMMCDGEGKKRIFYTLAFPEPTKDNWYEGSSGASASFVMRDNKLGYYDKITQQFIPYGSVGATSFTGGAGTSGASTSIPPWSNAAGYDNPFAGLPIA